MSSITFADILAKLDLGMADFLGDSKEDTYSKVWTYLTGLYTNVKNAPKPTETAEKVDPAYVTAWKSDAEAEAKASKIMANIVALVAKHSEGNAALTWHLRENAKSMLVKYLGGEVDWFEYLAEKDSATLAPIATSTRSLMAAEYQAGRLGLTQIYGLIGHDLKVPGNMISSDGKNTVPNLPALPGNYGSNGGASGSNAKVYRLNYNVDGTDYGTDAKLAMRAIYVGADRTGKTTTDLASLLERKIKDVYSVPGPNTFTYANRKVTISRAAD